MEKSCIKEINIDFLYQLGISDENIELITNLVNRAIEEKLYTDTKDFQHDIKHIERVLIFVVSIINSMKSKNIEILFEKELLLAALYHDIGKTAGASGRKHGIVGSKIFGEKLKNRLDEKSIKIIQLLIETHAQDNDIITFEDNYFTEEEQEAIQLISNILKDSDALDRTRLNYPAPIGKCDKKKLRTDEAIELLPFADTLLKEYNEVIIKNKGSKVIKSYETLDQWIKQYKNRQDDNGCFMFHGSLDPTIEELIPRQSTQKGFYVYSGIDPISCIKMAMFRTSTLFPRKDGVIYELFPGLIEETLKGKTITLYRLPEDKFHEYKEKVTSSPHREWVSEERITPIEEVTLDALECLKYLTENNLIKVKTNDSKEFIIDTLIDSFQMYVWNLKHNKGQQYLDKKFQMMISIIEYYNPSYLKPLMEIKNIFDKVIEEYERKYYETHYKKPDYNNEEHLYDIIKIAYSKITKEVKEFLLSTIENIDIVTIKF